MLLNIKQNKTVRDKKYFSIINKIIQSYIKNPNGDLILYGYPIDKLPENLKVVNGRLDIRRTNISELPKDLVVNGMVIMNYNVNKKTKYSKNKIIWI